MPLLAEALAVEEAPVIAPTAPAPGSPLPVQQAGTFRRSRRGWRRRCRSCSQRPMPTRAPSRHHRPLSCRQRTRRARPIHRGGAALSGGHRQGPGAASMAARRSSGSADVARRTRQVRRGDQDLSGSQDRHQVAAAGGRRADAAGSRLHEGGQEERSGPAFTRVVQEFPQSLYAADARREMEEAEEGRLDRFRRARERELADARRRADQREAARRRSLHR